MRPPHSRLAFPCHHESDMKGPGMESRVCWSSATPQLSSTRKSPTKTPCSGPNHGLASLRDAWSDRLDKPPFQEPLLWTLRATCLLRRRAAKADEVPLSVSLCERKMHLQLNARSYIVSAAFEIVHLHCCLTCFCS